MDRLSQAALLQGLSPEQVEQSRKENGSNELHYSRKSNFLKEFISGFGDPIIKILVGALFLNLLFMCRQERWYESAGIAIAVFLATFVSTLSEYGSESAFLKLQEEAAKTRCRVRRGQGLCEMSAGEIVCGDLVLLQSGERVPADGILLSGALYVDQSMLNGESKETKKLPGSASIPKKWSPDDQNQLFRGSVVCSGEGILLVLRVGEQTMLGGIASSLGEQPVDSPLKTRLNSLAVSVSKLGYLAAALVAMTVLFNGIVLDNGFHAAMILQELRDWKLLMGDLLQAATLAISVLVVAVPEGLPMMITVVLSRNMFRMLKDNVMVRKLVGIETAGSIHVLFTDKTGTLTIGRPQVQYLFLGTGKAMTSQEITRCAPLALPLWLSCRYNSSSTWVRGKALGGNFTDRALLEWLPPRLFDEDAYRRTDFLPFHSQRKISAAAIIGAHSIRLVKGAPERLLPYCRRCLDEEGRERDFTFRQTVEAKMKTAAMEGGRILCLCATREAFEDSGIYRDLILLGLVVIEDGVRPEAPQAIARLESAGIRVVMVTGDSLLTAQAVAKKAGMPDGECLTSHQLGQMSDKQVKEILPKLRVVARTLPGDKSRLIRLSQEMGLVTAMTGDGVNDAPALKLADVGFAMGSGTDVAREAGDIVILDDNIASISKAVLYGRTIFKSIQKFIVFQLMMNFCAVGVSIAAPFIGVDSPVTVVQMLWVNMVMDTLGGLAFAGEPPLNRYMEETPKDKKTPILSRGMLVQVLSTGGFTILMCLAFLKSPLIRSLFRPGENDIYLMTGFFALFIFAGVFNSFSVRTSRMNLFSDIFKNRSFVLIMSMVCITQMTMVYFGGELFRASGLTVKELFVTLLMAATVIPADLIRKSIIKKYRGKRVLLSIRLKAKQNIAYGSEKSPS